MSDFNRGYPRAASAAVGDMSIDAGLRGFMLGVYNKVALGLVLSAALAFAAAYVGPVHDALFRSIDGQVTGFTTLGTIVMWSPLALILLSSFAMNNPTPASSAILYWVFVSLMGLSLGVIVLIYSDVSLASTFLITAAAFAGLSLLGYTTKKDLSGFGSFLIMGLIGVIIAMVVNMFLHSGPLAFILNLVGLFIFSGLVAYKTQMLKMTYYQLGGNQAAMGVATNVGALSLYITFVNLFLTILRLMGGRR